MRIIFNDFVSGVSYPHEMKNYKLTFLIISTRFGTEYIDPDVRTHGPHANSSIRNNSGILALDSDWKHSSKYEYIAIQ